MIDNNDTKAKLYKVSDVAIDKKNSSSVKISQIAKVKNKLFVLRIFQLSFHLGSKEVRKPFPLNHLILYFSTSTYSESVTYLLHSSAARYMRPVGKHLAEMLVNLTSAGLEPDRLEFAGISLGAQIMSYVAKNFQEMTGRNISKLTGLDPSGPCFRNLGPEERLDASDGDFVQVVATNIDGYGMAAPMGHVNFYINGGEYQPGDLYWMPCTVLCSHVRAYTIWLSALHHPNHFIGIKCDSVQQARRNQCYDRVPRETNVLSNTKTDRNNPGIFYVATNNNWPYYLGAKGLRKENEFWTKHLLEWNKDDVIRM